MYSCLLARVCGEEIKHLLRHLRPAYSFVTTVAPAAMSWAWNNKVCLAVALCLSILYKR